MPTLKELLEYEEGEVYRSDETEVVLHLMARRLRKLRNHLDHNIPIIWEDIDRILEGRRL